jgi:hypothetical protein
VSATTPTRPHAVVIDAYVDRRSNTLRGFARVILPSGMILHDVGIFVDGGRAWATPSSKAMLDKDGVALRDDAKIRYSPVVTFVSKELRAKFSDAVIEAMRIAHPDALTDAS